MTSMVHKGRVGCIWFKCTVYTEQKGEFRSIINVNYLYSTPKGTLVRETGAVGPNLLSIKKSVSLVILMCM